MANSDMKMHIWYSVLSGVTIETEAGMELYGEC